MEMIEEKHEKMKDIIVFAIKLSVLSLVLYAISRSFNFYPFQEFTAQRIYDFLVLVESSASREGTRIVINEFNFIITEDCTAWRGMFFFFALVASSGKSVLDVSKGILVGIPVLYSLNLLRIVALMFTLPIAGPAYYDVLHGALWQTTMILFVFFLWIMWTKRTNFLTRENN